MSYDVAKDRGLRVIKRSGSTTGPTASQAETGRPARLPDEGSCGTGQGTSFDSDQWILLREQVGDGEGLMVWAEFEEKEFEIAFAVELGSGKHPAPVFSSGLVAEKILGYDAAANPQQQHQIWRLLKIERPNGVRLFPDHWRTGQKPETDQLPVSPISIIFQYKRPEYLQGSAARQWSRWQSPYFRIRRSDEQHSILRRIEYALGSEAKVRYAAPAFHKRGEYEHAVLGRQVMQKTGFVSPESLGSHKIWTYREPGTDGFPNPDGRAQRFDTVQDLFQDLLSSLGIQSGLQGSSELALHSGFDDHLARLAEAITYRRPTIRNAILSWERNIRAADLGIDDLTLRRVVRVATVQTAMTRIGATWHLSSAR